MSNSKPQIVVKHTFIHFDERSMAFEALESPLGRSKSAPGLLQSPASSSRRSSGSHVPCDANEDDEFAEQAEREGWTSVMLRNLPTDFSRKMLLNLLEEQGFASTFDFLYLPLHFDYMSCFGYAFVNFVSSEDAIRFHAHFNGFSEWNVDCEKVAAVCWSSKCQGLEAHIERYRNSPVMHKQVPDECKPIVLSNSVRVPFPRPTQNLQRPNFRGRRGRKCAAA
eukprot:gb/GFBE01045072.1/.p1 GENE.gb/GFBE01045072.1/~~gb/GFBE01045072.1/.p1  ORF type:complete len:223 (+),score=53.27 gb/GFBE01045072.1/:1-669(+)